ncbi:hypothetical protein I553_3562, partial [Mycobacterium xenopi 4042]
MAWLSEVEVAAAVACRPLVAELLPQLPTTANRLRPHCRGVYGRRRLEAQIAVLMLDSVSGIAMCALRCCSRAQPRSCAKVLRCGSSC